MKFIKCLKIALGMLKGSKLRSWLTVIGIVIAVSSVTTILSFSEAIKTEVNNQVGATGADVLELSSGWSEESSYITIQDLEFLKKLKEVKKVRRKRNVYGTISYFGEEKQINLLGTDIDSFDDFNTLNIVKGRGFILGDRNVLLIDEESLNDTFKKKPKLGSYIIIGEENYKIIGVYKSGGIFGSTGIMIPFDNSQDIFIEEQEKQLKQSNETEIFDFDERLPSGVSEDQVYSSIEIKLKDGLDITKSTESIKKELIKFRRTNEKEPNFYIQGKDMIMNEINKVVKIITWVLVGFAGISILVGSVGIANTMYTSVMEKTKEIGIMKAIGAKNKDIKLIFLLNSGLLGLFGGIIGVLIGMTFAFVGAFVVVQFANMTSFSYLGLLSFKVIGGALFFSILIGMMSGFLPSKQAAKLKPVDALRY